MNKKFKRIKMMMVMSLLMAIVLIFSGCNPIEAKGESEINQGEVRESIVDMAGRVVELPSEINKVYSTNPIGTLIVYTINPEKLSGWNYKINDAEKIYIPVKYYNLPVLGGWFGKNNTGNIEEIVKAAPDIIISLVVDIDENEISSADRIQEQTGIPVVIVQKKDVKSFGKCYEFLGKILNEETQCDALANYCKETINDTIEKVKLIPASDRINVYYAEGPKGLQTDPKGSIHSEVLELVGGNNVAEVKAQLGKGYGRNEVSLEQVLEWNPQVIITDQCEIFYQNIYENDLWKSIDAVKNKDVYGIPSNPYLWFDRPPSANQILGIKWLSNRLYPEVFDYEIESEVKVFYALFYHYDLSVEEAKKILEK